MNKKLLTTTALSTFALMSFAQLNDTALGLDVYGFTMKDSQHERCWVHFRSNDTHSLQRHDMLFPDDEYQIRIPRSGCMTPEGFVGYFDRQYTLTEEPLYFMKLNVNTGTYDVISDMTQGSKWSDYPVMYDLEYNWTSNTLYGLGRYTDYRGYASSGLYTVDPKTGEYKNIVQDLGFYALAMAVDYDGYFYFLKFYSTNDADIDGTILTKMELGADKKLHEIWSQHLLVDGEEFKINYTNDLVVDYTSGDLYWAADDADNWQRFIRVNPETCETNVLGRIGWYESVCSLYIPFSTAESRTAPAQVKDIEVGYSNRGQAVTLFWHNPTTRWNRTALTDLSSIYIARDSETNIIGSVDVEGQEGQRASFIDTEASQGVHTYYFIPANASGKGVPYKYLVQAGEDTPGSVENVSVTKLSDESLTLTWSKPVMGAHDGWYDEASLTYDIKRLPDGKQVATGLTATTFTDNDLASYDNYYYEITAVNAQGKGMTAKSAAVHAGTSIKAPYFTEFNSQENANVWTVIDNNHDGRSWEWWGANGVDIYQRMNLSCDYASNDLLVSPKLYVEAGKTYRVSADVFMDYVNTYRVQLLGGTDPNPEALTIFATYDNTIGENDDDCIHYMLEGTFEAEETGNYHVAVRSLSAGSTSSNVAVFSVRFEEVPTYDLSVADVTVVPDGVMGTEMQATLHIVNRGLKTVKAADYSVEAFETETGTVLGRQAGTSSVLFDDYEDVTLNFTPQTVGKVGIAFRVVSALDGDATNNVSQTYPFTIAEAGTSEWNLEITEGIRRGERNDYETRVPFDFMGDYSVLQSIYPYDAIGMSGYITRIGYRYSRVNNFSGMPMCAVSLATTDSEYYTVPSDALPTAMLTSVYYGPLELDASDGEHIVAFDFDAPFLLEEGENLVVNITHEGGVKEVFPIMAEVFNKYTNVYGSVRAASDAKLPILATAGQCIEAIPCILLSISDKSGVHEVEVAPVRQPDTYYDLLGRRSNAAAKGINVVGGKKSIR